MEEHLPRKQECLGDDMTLKEEWDHWRLDHAEQPEVSFVDWLKEQLTRARLGLHHNIVKNGELSDANSQLRDKVDALENQLRRRVKPRGGGRLFPPWHDLHWELYQEKCRKVGELEEELFKLKAAKGD